VREVVACLSGDDGILNIGDHSEQLLWPDAAKLSVSVRLNQMVLLRWRSYGW